MMPCVTSLRRDPCVVYGEHHSGCRGFRALAGQLVECSGCLPQPATRGMLCESCFVRFTESLDVAVDLITHLRSIERSGAALGEKVSLSKPGSRVIVPVSWLTADALWAALHELVFRIDESVDFAGNGTTPHGFGFKEPIERVRDLVTEAVVIARDAQLSLLHIADLAVDFYRSVQAALFQFPIEEQARLLPYARCSVERGGCGSMTLQRRPPLQYLDALVYSCVNPACGAKWDPFVVEAELAVYRKGLEERS